MIEFEKLPKYTPLGAKENELLPVFFSIYDSAGGTDFEDSVFHRMANEVRCRVINIDFRLPQGYSTEECYQAVVWASKNAERLGIDAERMALGGHSSGAVIAVAVAEFVRDHGDAHLRCVLLDSPIMSLQGGDKSGLPDTFVLAGGEDPQISAIEEYVKSLRRARVRVEYARLDGCEHGFTIGSRLTGAGKIDHAWNLINSYLKRKLAT